MVKLKNKKKARMGTEAVQKGKITTERPCSLFENNFKKIQAVILRVQLDW